MAEEVFLNVRNIYLFSCELFSRIGTTDLLHFFGCKFEAKHVGRYNAFESAVIKLKSCQESQLDVHEMSALRSLLQNTSSNVSRMSQSSSVVESSSKSRNLVQIETL